MATKTSGTKVAATSAQKNTGAKKNDSKRVVKSSVAVKVVPPEIKVSTRKKILLVASESTPFIATGGLAEVIGSLSKALARNSDLDVRVVIPLYSEISDQYRKKMKYHGNIFVPLAWRNQYCGIFSYEQNGVIFYFLDN